MWLSISVCVWTSNWVKWLGTHYAYIWLITSVNDTVLFQMTTLDKDKWLATYSTPTWLITSVNEHVRIQIMSIFDRLAADYAHMWILASVDDRVPFQTATLGKWLATHFAVCTLNGLIPMWIKGCRLKLLPWLNDVPQTLHTYGRSSDSSDIKQVL